MVDSKLSSFFTCKIFALNYYLLVIFCFFLSGNVTNLVDRNPNGEFQNFVKMFKKKKNLQILPFIVKLNFNYL